MTTTGVVLHRRFTLVDDARQGAGGTVTLVTLLVGRALAAHVRTLFDICYASEEYKAVPAPSEHQNMRTTASAVDRIAS